MQAVEHFNAIGVARAGQMGAGIAQLFLAIGHQVVHNYLSNYLLETAIASIRQRLDREVQRGTPDHEQLADCFGRLIKAEKLQDLGGCQVVIEAATESEDVKRRIFESLSANLPPETYFVSNTSSISITRLASLISCPERFMGVHFMNPVSRMQLVELIRGITTSQETHTKLKELVEATGKTTTVSEDYPAFIVNRILIPMINEAVYVLHEGVGSVTSIDSSMKLGANHPMGPLELDDFIGLDTCLSIMNVLHDGFADTKYRPCPLLVKYVEAGWTGRKSGRGFYDYSGEHPVPTR